ncbi:MAG: autotransporter outer membrane beta-barrel domain-containing protein, partial [Bacteroidales bacterium]|nr:autotransporter outer membrane beta-barrel domain-containing protein [Bacteroidales bacterium]
YTATGTTLDSISLTGWNGTEGSIPTGWTSALGNNSITAVSVDGSSVAPGNEQNILTSGTENFFNDNQITDALKYKEYGSSSDTCKGVTLTYSESKGVKASTDGKNLVYARSDKNVSNISFGGMEWGWDMDAKGGYDYTNANIDFSKFTFTNPDAVTGSTTLLKANNTLAEIAATEKKVSYAYSPVAGVTVNGTVNGSYKTTNANEVQYTATENKADKLTFGNVEWKDTGALMERPANITFAGAAVDTSNINFTNISELEANKEMTLVGNFGDTVGTITGTKYMVGSTLQGEGKASLEGSNLIFRTDTTAEKMEVQEQTHNTVMSEEVALEALGAGDDFIAAAEDGLGHAGNVGADGVASFATMGGGSIRQETGSHVDTHTWNAILALGHQNKKERGTMEYGAFFEYGTGNYTTHADNGLRGDGSARYTGGGLLAKYTMKNSVYVEGSLRAGSAHDDARNVLSDGFGNPYSYETDAPYWGVHVGVGKVIQLNESSELDVYGKFFHNHRNSVSFDAGGHYDLDAVNSDVLRLGTRYVMKREKWNFYGGLAYEQEFSGKAEGTADGRAIRGADTSGGSLRAELGAVLNPKKDGPITLDFNLSGFAGKKRGLTGGVAVTFNF